MKYFLGMLFFVFVALSCYAQNPYNYDSKIVLIRIGPDITGNVNYFRAYGDPFPGGSKLFTGTNYQPLFQTVLNEVCHYYNGNGYKTVSMMIDGSPDFENFNRNATYNYRFLFEKSDSYREAELYKLINELNTSIDTTSKKYVDSAMVDIHTNVLNYLKSIPNEVITQAYKAQLTKTIMAKADEKLKEVVEEIKREIRNSAIINDQ